VFLDTLSVRRRVQQLLDAVLARVNGILSLLERSRVRVSQGGCDPSVGAACAGQFPHERSRPAAGRRRQRRE
jgi:hypothetical protein